MDSEEATGNPPGGGLSHSAVEALTSIVIVVIGMVMMIDNYKLGASWGPEGPQSGYFPFHIGLILGIAGMALLLKTLFGKHRNHTVFVTWERFRLVLVVLVPTAAYVLAIQFVGIYVASAVFIGSFMRVMGKSRWINTLLVSLGTVVLLFWMFEIQFLVPLPKGPLEALLGY